MLNGCLNGAYWVFFKLPHKPHHAGLFECRRAPCTIIVCMHLHIFNLNLGDQCFPCRCRTCISSSITSLVLERVFTFRQSLQPWAWDAFKAAKPVEPRITHFELLLWWQKLNTTNSLQNNVNNTKKQKRPHLLLSVLIQGARFNPGPSVDCFVVVSFLALSLSTSLARMPPCTWSTWSSRPPMMETMTPSEWSFWLFLLVGSLFLSIMTSLHWRWVDCGQEMILFFLAKIFRMWGWAFLAWPVNGWMVSMFSRFRLILSSMNLFGADVCANLRYLRRPALLSALIILLSRRLCFSQYTLMAVLIQNSFCSVW